MEKKLVAVCGKGGSGKTALVALLTKYLLENKNQRLLVIDADPTMNLSSVLGLSPGKTVNTIREQIIREARKAGKTEKNNLARSLESKRTVSAFWLWADRNPWAVIVRSMIS
jgi:CO dehydrogenase maturation factor